MRLANGIIIDKEKTFGVLKFSALRREVHIQNEDGTVSEEIKERTYDLKCKEQGRMIQVNYCLKSQTYYCLMNQPIFWIKNILIGCRNISAV